MGAHSRCQSFMFAEGDRHMYTGTCELYDGFSINADGNNGWSCYRKNTEKAIPVYNKHQGICKKSKNEDPIKQLRWSSKDECQKECDANPSCQTYLFGEGEAHMYTNTCELYSSVNTEGDGNQGWSCYAKEYKFVNTGNQDGFAYIQNDDLLMY